MQWRFIDAKTVSEKYSGYTIHLLSGTWVDPNEVRPIAPKNLKFILQAELLRTGLEFAFDHFKEPEALEEVEEEV